MDVHARRKAAALANSLGIPIYVRDDRLYQKGPGERFDPPTRPEAPHGAETAAAKES